MNNSGTPLLRALFITFEGGEGCGKSTQSKMLYEYLISKNIKVVHTREIGGTLEAEKVRQILLHSHLYTMTELLLVMAARYEHLKKVVIPALEQGAWVICDRFIDSTACYQGHDPEIGAELVYKLHEQLMPGIEKDTSGEIKGNSLMPDLTFFLDLPPTTGLQRTQQRQNNNKFEEKNLKFHQQIAAEFGNIASNFPDRIIRINAKNLSPQEVHGLIIESIDPLLSG